MAERWRKPLVPLLIEPLPEGIWLPDGRVQGQVSFTLLSTDIDRLRSGYACAKCLEVFEQAWPERCPLCGAPVRSEQAAFFAREYGGEERLGSSVSLEDELEQLDERRKEEESQDGR